MVWGIRDIDIIITASELEALTLEATLIKQHQPFYNVLLKDDKSYPYVKITYGEKYPRVVLARDLTKDPKARYYGPFSALTVRRALEIIHETFPIRECPWDLKSPANARAFSIRSDDASRRASGRPIRRNILKL